MKKHKVTAHYKNLQAFDLDDLLDYGNWEFKAERLQRRRWRKLRENPA